MLCMGTRDEVAHLSNQMPLTFMGKKQTRLPTTIATPPDTYLAAVSVLGIDVNRPGFIHARNSGPTRIIIVVTELALLPFETNHPVQGIFASKSSVWWRILAPGCDLRS